MWQSTNKVFSHLGDGNEEQRDAVNQKKLAIGEVLKDFVEYYVIESKKKSENKEITEKPKGL